MALEPADMAALSADGRGLRLTVHELLANLTHQEAVAIVYGRSAADTSHAELTFESMRRLSRELKASGADDLVEAVQRPALDVLKGAPLEGEAAVGADTMVRCQARRLVADRAEVGLAGDREALAEAWARFRSRCL